MFGLFQKWGYCPRLFSVCVTKAMQLRKVCQKHQRNLDFHSFNFFTFRSRKCHKAKAGLDLEVHMISIYGKYFCQSGRCVFFEKKWQPSKLKVKAYVEQMGCRNAAYMLNFQFYPWNDMTSLEIGLSSIIIARHQSQLRIRFFMNEY